MGVNPLGILPSWSALPEVFTHLWDTRNQSQLSTDLSYLAFLFLSWWDHQEMMYLARSPSLCFPRVLSQPYPGRSRLVPWEVLGEKQFSTEPCLASLGQVPLCQTHRLREAGLLESGVQGPFTELTGRDRACALELHLTLSHASRCAWSFTWQGLT